MDRYDYIGKKKKTLLCKRHKEPLKDSYKSIYIQSIWRIHSKTKIRPQIQ